MFPLMPQHPNIIPVYAILIIKTLGMYNADGGLFLAHPCNVWRAGLKSPLAGLFPFSQQSLVPYPVSAERMKIRKKELMTDTKT